MRNLLILFIFSLSFFHGQAQVYSATDNSQISDPVTWKASVEKENDSIYTLIFKATIDEGWHMYSQKEADIELAPIPTAFTFNDSIQSYQLVG
ncbi:MAG: hypothetical protein WAM00_10025, partial [Salegentibacter sp.]